MKTKKIFIVDVYIANVLKELSKFAKLPFPSKELNNIRVIFPPSQTKRLTDLKFINLFYRIKTFKITKDEISKKADKIVMITRPSLKYQLEHIKGIEGGDIIYSMWEGYLKKKDTKDFLYYLTRRKFTFQIIHTSGHADLNTLKEMVRIIKPKYLVPIHTFKGKEFKNIFKVPTLELKDKEEFTL